MTEMATRRVELELDERLIERASAAGIDLPSELESALRRRFAEPDAGAVARWQEENREAIEAWNAYIDTHGLPLARYRMF